MKKGRVRLKPEHAKSILEKLKAVAKVYAGVDELVVKYKDIERIINRMNPEEKKDE